MWIIIIGYLVGSLLGGRLYGVLSGHDLATTGSKNTGARNAHRIGGVKAFLIVYGFDVLKTILVLQMSGPYFWETAFALTLGHIYPFWRIHAGGKGYAVFSGIIWAYDPWWFIGGLAILLVLIKLTGNSRETGLVMLTLLPLAAFGSLEDVIWAILIAIVITYHHMKEERT
ncbi:MAG: glycerol-3-phosphate acyltransferase [Exiguobacterium sp.]|uniref:glycerol-3-phosphate acyltransferase n=1 Tax=Exiguobacterium sp. MER 193 TaxID=2939564 RepID=UPI00203B6AB8|nr:glycerol-3-phosphate acyltransferase [Exiguobacterium sp. MER 193]MBR2076064.1 glycerol-3-phosphate acyltransferase [Exiguobacterium sp.]MBR3215430.1 glycerol-3-phosphate acyltransferase [Exiguobacterium sp.]MCM3280052.1 glycerol-3-phosphate acyltransferase [Exiguobacterium sp. MER 193]